MDPVSLSIGALAAAFVLKAVEKAGEIAAESIPSAVGKVRDWLYDRFSHNDQEAATALARAEDAPDSPSRLQILAEVIDQRAAADSTFRIELEEMLAQAQMSGVDMKAVSQVAEGIGIVQIANTDNSTITVNQGPAPVPVARPAAGTSGV